MRQIAPNAQRAHARVQVVLEGLGEAAESAVLLVPSFSIAARYRKEWAEKPYSFGLTITTLAAWVTERWELYGDGRQVITSTQRNLLMYRALCEVQKNNDGKVLAVSPGTIKMLSSIAQESLPSFIRFIPDDSVHTDLDEQLNLGLSEITDSEEMEQSGNPACPGKLKESLTAAELEVCEVLNTYAVLLHDEGLCEITQAMMALAELTWPVPTLIIEAATEFSAAEEQFIATMGKRSEVFVFEDDTLLPAKIDGRANELVELQSCIFEPEPDNPVKPTGAVSFLLPAGRYAAPLLIGHNIIDLAGQGDKRIALSASQPEVLFRELAPYLSRQGFAVSVSAHKRFVESDFGKVWTGLMRFLFDESYSIFQMSDVLLSPFSDVASRRAYELDALWRSDRTSDKQRCIDDVSESSEMFAKVIISLQKNDFNEALAIFEKVVSAQFSWSAAYRAEQMTAISAARGFSETAEAFKAGVVDTLPLLEGSQITFSACLEGETTKSPRVDIMMLETLAFEAPCSYDAVVICDLDASHYPIRDAQDAKTRLFEKWGIKKPEDALGQARKNFFRVLSVPIRHLVCERVLNDVNANEAYPAVMLEELLDCYRRDLVSLDELDKEKGVPKVLLPFTQVAGENLLYEDIALLDTSQKIIGYEELSSPGQISENSRAKIVLPAQGKERLDDGKLTLSPSAIESYLECPYKWFALRRLRLDGIDAGFGPLEMGNFTHSVLKNFYTLFQNTGSAKVTAGNLSDAKNLLSEVFDQFVERQAEMKPSDRPLIATTKLEEAEVASLKKRLLDYLEREVDLLPGFTPRYFELDFGKESSLEYAGHYLHGTIDRIDVNDKGQAVVVDYKGSLSPEYAFNDMSEVSWVPCDDQEKILLLPHKVQALLYAQAVRKELGLDVVAALYVSYGKDKRVLGAYNQQILGPAELLGIKPDACAACSDANPDFASVLDSAEDALADVLKCLSKGHISPHPRGKDPCGFCPVTACELRRRP